MYMTSPQDKGAALLPDSNITKNALSAALKELMCVRPLAKISVGDICERCGMNRKSFYYHFKDKYDLVNWIFYTELLDYIQGKFTGDVKDTWALTRMLCEYFADNKNFYQNALSVQGQNSFYEYFGEVLTSVIEQNLESIFDDGEHRDFYTALFADAFRCVIIRWLTEGAKIPPHEFVQLLYNALRGIGYRILSDDNLNCGTGTVE